MLFSLQRLGDGYTISHIAISRGDLESLRLYVMLGADPEARNYNSTTSQQLAFLLGRRDMVELCQRGGASSRQLDYLEEKDRDEYRNQRLVWESLKKSFDLDSNSRKRPLEWCFPPDSVAYRVKVRRRRAATRIDSSDSD